MNEDLTLSGLSGPLATLRLLAVDFPHLTAPVVEVSPIYPKVLRLSLHGMTCDSFGAFEQWRHALRIEPDSVDFHIQCDHRTAVLDGHGTYGGAEIELTAYATVPAGDTALAEQAGGTR
ncbi:hypothetical protein OG194_14890 [Streptomyces sp. NBC_01288]|uniref:hypothetical protein n=1 Tax=Streptomyces sp. NBC_01288 TaxID=2903814 RepID=UPI002E13AA2F|nr:hypothetical protein OG194_14890 [Streptomyces sp. NBC_01288]